MADDRGKTPELYERKLVKKCDRWLIRSVCQRCGAAIVGSVTETLAADEERHANECRKRNRLRERTG